MPCGIYPEIQEEGNIQQSRKRTRRTVPRVRHPEGGRDSRGACREGPCPHAGVHTAQVQRLASREVHKGEVRNLDCAELLRETAELHGTALPGALLACERRGRGEKVIAEYIRNQERMDIQGDCQPGLGV